MYALQRYGTERSVGLRKAQPDISTTPLLIRPLTAGRAPSPEDQLRCFHCTADAATTQEAERACAMLTFNFEPGCSQRWTCGLVPGQTSQATRSCLC